MKKFNIQRAEMFISMNLLKECKKQLDEVMEKLEIEQTSIKKIVDKSDGKRIEVFLYIEPSKFRPISSMVKEELPDCVMEVISNVVTNDSVQEIENAGNANLTLRDDWKEEETDKKGKKKPALKEEVKKLEEDNEEAAEEDDEEVEGEHKKKKKNKKKNPQIDNRFANKEREFEFELARIEEMNKAKEKLILDEQKKQGSSIEEQKNKGSKKCSSCKDAYFETNDEYRLHFKTEWHLSNLKRKQKTETLLSEIEYKLHKLDASFA